MKALQIITGVFWVFIMWIASTSNTEYFLTVGTTVVFIIISFMDGDSDIDPIKARKIIIKYNDGNKQEVMGTEWERYSDVVAVYNNELEDNSVLEINLDSMRSIGFAKRDNGE